MVYEKTANPASLAEHIGRTVKLHGAVHKIRRMRGFAFILLRGARSLTQCVYSPEFSQFSLDTLREESCVRLTGEVVADERSRAGYEVRALSLEILSEPSAPMPIVINNKELPATLEGLLDHRPLTLRNVEQRAIFKLQEGIAQGFRSYCRGQGLTQIHTPKLVSAGAEGGANIFRLDYFGRDAYLAQSPQLYKQMMVGVFERVYEIGPVFRAEKHDTSRHLNEYTSMDAEIGYLTSLNELMRFQQGLLEHTMALLAAEYAPEIELLEAEVPRVGEIPSVDFRVAKELLASRLGFVSADPEDFEPEEERLLGEHALREWGCDFLFVTGYPSAKRPFYALDDPEDPCVTLSYDLLFRGLEITTGGLRIHRYDAQVEKMRARNMNPEAFAPYLAVHQHGVPPHGGFGMGLERVTARILNLANVRYATLFPRDTARLEP